jgi:hypothetical protein
MVTRYLCPLSRTGNTDHSEVARCYRSEVSPANFILVCHATDPVKRAIEETHDRRNTHAL